MLISLLHATKRTKAGKECQERWLNAAENRANVEIITCVDADDEGCQKAFSNAVISHGKGACAAWNEAAKHAKGDILVILDDDFFPVFGWDELIRSYMTNGADILHVGDKHRKDDLICHPIVSRRFYDTIGYIWHPRFKSVYCDNWFTTMAKAWGYVDATEGGKIDLGFLHANPSQNYGVEDEVARISNSKERYAEGEKTMERLIKNNMVLAFTACDRVDYLKTTLDSWLKTNLSLVTSVQFFIEPTDKLEAIKSVIEEFEAKCPSPVIIHVNPERYGVLRNPWELFHNLFDKQLATFVILAEDDFIVSPDTLDFLDFGRLHAQPKTLAVCCKNMGKTADENPMSYTYVEGFDGNIWGTWADKWRSHLKDSWDFDYSSGKEDDTPSGWDWNIGLRIMPKNNFKCLIPTASRSYHIGIQGVHCTEQEYALTTTTNFVREPYKGKYVEIGADEADAVKKIATCNITSAGDIGDIFASIPTIIARGEVVNYLLRDNGQTKGIVGRMPLIKELLETQPCIAEVREWQEGDEVSWVSEQFRSMGLHGNGDNLAGVHAQCAIQLGFIQERPDLSKQWLFVKPDIRWANRVVINRTDRYRNGNFPWKMIMDHYGKRLAFIGSTEEHQQFQNQFGEVEYVFTANMMEAARMIAGSALFVGNQSSCMVIAEGLKHPRIQETCLWLPDCIYPKADNAQYVATGACELPDVSGSGTLKIKPQIPLPEGMETPPGGWQFPGIPPNIQHPAHAVMMVRQQKPEWTREKAHEELMRYNLERMPEFFDKSALDGSYSRFRLARANAGYTNP